MRERVSLRPPPDNSANLRGFPHKLLNEGTTLWRVVRRGQGPWWFSNSLAGRFDLPSPNGTCYLAFDDIGALLEAVGPDIAGGAVSESFVAARRLRRLVAPHPHRAGDLGSRRAAGFGVAAEIHTIVPYALPQAWASALHAAGAEALFYRLRHDSSFKGKGVALFGKQGERPWKRGREAVIDPALKAKLRRVCGVRILPIPRQSQLRVIED